jgi:hypothetical protein
MRPPANLDWGGDNGVVIPREEKILLSLSYAPTRPRRSPAAKENQAQRADRPTEGGGLSGPGDILASGEVPVKRSSEEPLLGGSMLRSVQPV